MGPFQLETLPRILSKLRTFGPQVRQQVPQVLLGLLVGHHDQFETRDRLAEGRIDPPPLDAEQIGSGLPQLVEQRGAHDSLRRFLQLLLDVTGERRQPFFLPRLGWVLRLAHDQLRDGPLHLVRTPSSFLAKRSQQDATLRIQSSMLREDRCRQLQEFGVSRVDGGSGGSGRNGRLIGGSRRVSREFHLAFGNQVEQEMASENRRESQHPRGMRQEALLQFDRDDPIASGGERRTGEVEEQLGGRFGGGRRHRRGGPFHSPPIRGRQIDRRLERSPFPTPLGYRWRTHRLAPLRRRRFRRRCGR